MFEVEFGMYVNNSILHGGCFSILIEVPSFLFFLRFRELFVVQFIDTKGA